MNNSTKEQIGCDIICKSHSARTERDLYRICPSKLSKRELEDLYFALLENNLELKKTINVQQDKIKVLSTRLQRMTVVHKNVAGKEKDCCASKAVVSEQRESLTELKKTNERMAERIRLLNMKLCSAKQFLKRSPLQSTNCNKICTRCTFKNSSMSALNAKQTDSNMRTTTVSCQFLEKDVAEKTTKTAETATEIPEKDDSEKLCNENKCRTMMDELKEKIVYLQEELAISHKGYSERIGALEAQVTQLHEEKVRARAEHAASEHKLHERGRKADLLQDQLRTADAKCNELNMELSIEKSKVTELETGLKLANMSKHVVETINQLTAEKEDKQEPLSELCRNGSGCSVVSQKQRVPSPKQTQLEIPPTTKTKNNVKISISEDSGYTELNKSCEADEDQVMVKMNQELLKKIADLQTQLDLLRISAAGEVGCKQIRKPNNLESYDVETKNVEENQTPNAVDPELILLDQASEMECTRKRKPKEFESYGVETKDIDETQAENAADREFMLKSTSEDESKADRYESSPRGYEQMASSSNPCGEYLVSERNAEHNEDTMGNDNMNRFVECAIKQKFEARVREDEHNSLQIPGPIPIVYPAQSHSKDKINNKNTPNRRDSNNERPKTKKAYSEEKTVKIFENSKDSYFNSVKANGSAGGKPKELAVVANLKKYAGDIEGVQNGKDIAEKKQRNVSITSMQAKLADRTPTRDSIIVNRKKMASDLTSMAEVKKESTTSFYLESVCTPPSSALRPDNVETGQATSVHQDDDTSVYQAQIVPPPIPNQRDSATYTADAGNTYTVEVEKRSRATSPDNTEHEISSMTDLPSEKDMKSPRAELSPGEEKATMTYTDTETMLTDYGSLSEGEMPAGGNVRTPSIGEAPLYATRSSMPFASSSEKMEATLQSISEELARCRELLHSQRPQEKDWAQGTPGVEVGHALRHSAPGTSIANSRAPSCVFTLHIGTMVLSDESVLFTREKTLVLTWKFYCESAAMTRVHSGRVVQFHFDTEYHICFDDKFLNYMKNSDMAIVLCEMSQQGEPFAMCSLPLREALLHANRRADMSLALIPTSVSKRDSVGDEIGVLDLWCTLKVDRSLLPEIRRAMHTPSPPNCSNLNPLRSDSKVDQQVMEEGLSRELALSLKQGHVSGTRCTGREPQRSSAIDGEYSARMVQGSSTYEDENCYSRPYHRRSSQTQKCIPYSELGHKGQVGFESDWPNDPLRQESSGIIVNEVPVTIRSTEGLKQALDRNVQQKNVTRLPKMDEDAAQVRSSIGFVKNLAARHQVSKLRWSKNKTTKERVDSLLELLKKRKGSSMVNSIPAASMERYVKDEDSDRSLSKINNIKKYIGLPGLNKLVEATKKSVKYTDVPSPVEPEKENSADSDEPGGQSIDITILWLALNEECEAMVNPKIQRLYVAYSFLGRKGADLETPCSLPKPKHYGDKCYFNFKKTFHLHECDLPLLGHMSRCRAGSGSSADPRDCIVFTLVSEPPEDPLGLSSCEDIGYAYLYLGDVLAYSGGSGGYTEVLGVRAVRGGVCGVLAVRVDQLPVLHRCLSLSHSHHYLQATSLSHSRRTSPLPAHSSSTLPMFKIE